MCAETITFTDDDMMLGDEQHNRPLFVSGSLGGERINRILLDAGSAVNILPIKTFKKLGYTANQLNPCTLIIQGACDYSFYQTQLSTRNHIIVA